MGRAPSIVIAVLLFLVIIPTDGQGMLEDVDAMVWPPPDRPQNLTLSWAGDHAVLSWSPPTYRTDEVIGYNVSWHRGGWNAVPPG